MSRERAQRRAKREAAAAALAERRAAEAEKRARSEARRARWLGWLPTRDRRRRGPTGILAERRRQQLAATLALLVGVNLLAYAFSPSWGLRAFVLVASLLGAPVIHVMLDRRS